MGRLIPGLGYTDVTEGILPGIGYTEEVSSGGLTTFQIAWTNVNKLIEGMSMSFKKNTAVTGFAFGLISATDGSDITTGTVTGKYILDGGVQGTIAGAFTHEGSGQWSVNLTAAEMNGDIVGLAFTEASAITVHFTIKTVTVLTSDLNDFDAINDTVANVTLVETTTANTDMRGTDGANTVIPDNAGIAAIEVDTQDIQSRLPAALVAGRIDADVSAISGNSAAADNLQSGAIGNHPDVITGIPTTTTFNLTSGSTVNDIYNGRVIIVTSGTNIGGFLVVTDYVGSTGLVTFEATPYTLSSGDNIVIV